MINISMSQRTSSDTSNNLLQGTGAAAHQQQQHHPQQQYYPYYYTAQNLSDPSSAAAITRPLSDYQQQVAAAVESSATGAYVPVTDADADRQQQQFIQQFGAGGFGSPTAASAATSAAIYPQQTIPGIYDSPLLPAYDAAIYGVSADALSINPSSIDTYDINKRIQNLALSTDSSTDVYATARAQQQVQAQGAAQQQYPSQPRQAAYRQHSGYAALAPTQQQQQQQQQQPQAGASLESTRRTHAESYYSDP
jgi:hypothetical protein